MNESNRPRVLVVDDQADMAAVIADALIDEGYNALAAYSGGQALEVLQSVRVDAVVTDLTMPHVNGLEVLRTSQRLDPSRPVILMTGFGGIDSALKALDVGAYQYMLKPFRMEALLRALRKAIGQGET